MINFDYHFSLLAFTWKTKALGAIRSTSVDTVPCDCAVVSIIAGIAWVRVDKQIKSISTKFVSIVSPHNDISL